MRILIFGAGKYYNFYKKYLTGHIILAILDNNKKIQGSYVDGHIVVPPEKALKYKFDRIYIFSYYMREMYEQLLDVGIPKGKIYFTFDLCDALDKTIFKIYSYPQNENAKKITFISHDFSITGAPNCLFYAVKCIKKLGYYITVASPTDGAMRKQFSALGVEVIIDERLLLGSAHSIDYLNTCDLLFINTAQMHYLLPYVKNETPVIWWVHELPRMYQSVVPQRLARNIKDNLWVYAVSDIARAAFCASFPAVNPGLLLYGVPDVGIKKIVSPYDPIMKFIIIGGVGEGKGHDILLEAIKNLPRDCRDKLIVWCIGDSSSKAAEKIKAKVFEEQLPIKFKGTMPNTDVMEFLNKVDVLICASRGETMSMAVTEAMMKGIPAILPDKIGIADFIEDKVNGYLFRQDDSRSLSQCIKYCLENRYKSVEVGRAARKIYEKYFSIEVFYKKISAIVKSRIS